jgi:hypothetical protein
MSTLKDLQHRRSRRRVKSSIQKFLDTHVDVKQGRVFYGDRRPSMRLGHRRG